MNIIFAGILIATAYAPLTTRINGGRLDFTGLPVDKYTIACAREYQAHVFVFNTDIPDEDIRVCSDRGGMVWGKYVDIAILGEGRYNRAIQWGKRKVEVKIIAPDEFLKAHNVPIPKTNKEKIIKIKGILASGKSI